MCTLVHIPSPVWTAWPVYCAAGANGIAAANTELKYLRHIAEQARGHVSSFTMSCVCVTRVLIPWLLQLIPHLLPDRDATSPIAGMFLRELLANIVLKVSLCVPNALMLCYIGTVGVVPAHNGFV